MEEKEMIKRFIKKLLSDGKTNGVSSKRFCAVLGFLVILCIMLIVTFKQKGILPEWMFNSFLWLLASLFGISGVEKILSQKKD